MDDPHVCMSAFERHNDHVIQTAPRERLLIWEAGDGWAPICNALNLPIPDAPFPKANSTEEFQQRVLANIPPANS